jgi:hypothetical protein
MRTKNNKLLSELGLKVILWVLIAVYTFLLPYFLLVYRAILNSYGKEIVGKVPLVIVAAFGIAYVIAVLRVRKEIKYLLFLIPCGVIAFLIMRLEPNPNKHIHIPEYVVMAWLLFAVLSRDYKGKGIFILTFIYTSLLGVVDELEQGIIPSRFYGLSDMLVNCASAAIGVFTIMGLKKVRGIDWAWTGHLKEHKGLLWLSVYGLIGAAAMVVYLFQVQAGKNFWGIYPIWLWVWELLYLILAPVLISIYLVRHKKSHQAAEGNLVNDTPLEVKTAQLWIYPLLAILFYMHSLLIYISVSGVEFI